MQYKLHLSLKQRAALRTAISFWETKEVQDKIIEFFTSCDENTRETKNEWYKLTKVKIEEWNKDLLPQNLEVELIHIVKMIGETIFMWYQYIKHNFNDQKKSNHYICILIRNIFYNIYWTPYGTVDEIQIFKSFSLNNPDLSITKVYNIACNYALEEHINDLWSKIPIPLQDDCHKNIYQLFDRHILVYWKHCRDDDLPNLMRSFHTASEMFNNRGIRIFNLLYNLDHSLEENVLRLSVYQGYYFAVKYFWAKLTEEERNESVLKCARITIMCYHFNERGTGSIRDYMRNQYTEICIFLMNQMTKSHKKAFFNEKLGLDDAYESRAYSMHNFDLKDEILKMLLSTWPWQELFMPVLKDMLQYQDDNSTMYCTFLNAITDKLYEDYKLGYSVESSKYRRLLREVWLIFPRSVKQKIGQGETDYNFLDNLIHMRDMDSLKLILDDPEIVTVRERFINLGLDSHRQFILNDQFEIVNQFIEAFLRSEEEKKIYKELIDVWDRVIISQFHLADKYLEWQCCTSEKKKCVKSNIDHKQICEDLIMMRKYELIDKFLNWKFETEEGSKMSKDHFKNDIFTIRCVCAIWMLNKSNLEKSKNQSFKFLHWLLESEEEIALFTKKMLVNFQNDHLVTHYLDALKRLDIIDEFLSWCLLSDEEIQRIKEVLEMTVN